MGLFDKLGSKKREAFYSEYAATHDLKRSTMQIDPVTKNLAGEVITKERFDGKLATGFTGTIAFVETTIRATSEVVTTDRDASINTWLPEGTVTTETHESTNVYPSTVVMVQLEKVTGLVSGLAVKKNYKKQSMGNRDTYGDLRRLPTDGLDLEDRFYVFADENADSEKVRQLFSPPFSAWLNERPDKFFSFEVGQGMLVTKHGGKFPKEAEPIDGWVAETCEIARRLEAEAGSR